MSLFIDDVTFYEKVGELIQSHDSLTQQSLYVSQAYDAALFIQKLSS